MTPALLKSSKTKDKYYKKCINRSKDSPEYIKYAKYSNEYNKQKRNMKQQYYAELLNDYKYDSRKTWSLLNRITGRNCKKTTTADRILAHNNQTVTDPKRISNEFCKYFSDVGNQFAAKIPKPSKQFDKHLLQRNNNSLFMYPSSPDEIQKIIATLKPKNSFGHDLISTKLVKHLANPLAKPLSVIINKSFESGNMENC